jgi:hypothetical protein
MLGLRSPFRSGGKKFFSKNVYVLRGFDVDFDMARGFPVADDCDLDGADLLAEKEQRLTNLPC